MSRYSVTQENRVYYGIPVLLPPVTDARSHLGSDTCHHHKASTWTLAEGQAQLERPKAPGKFSVPFLDCLHSVSRRTASMPTREPSEGSENDQVFETGTHYIEDQVESIFTCKFPGCTRQYASTDGAWRGARRSLQEGGGVLQTACMQFIPRVTAASDSRTPRWDRMQA